MLIAVGEPKGLLDVSMVKATSSSNLDTCNKYVELAMTERERKVQERTMKVVRQHGGYVYKNAQNMYTEKGRPDLTACVPTTVKRLLEVLGPDAKVGLFVGIELKREGLLANVSEAQKIVGNQIKKANGMWFAIDNSELIEALMVRFSEEE